MDIHKKALEHIRNNEWDAAHELVQPHSDKLSCLIHACLHRIEGDLSNAQYWYRKAGERMPSNEIEEELKSLQDTVS